MGCYPTELNATTAMIVISATDNIAALGRHFIHGQSFQIDTDRRLRHLEKFDST